MNYHAVWNLTAVVTLALVATTASGQGRNRPETSQLTAEQAADRQVWIDEQARWNAEHMAAARRLEGVVAALRQHDTGFDLHGRELRAHGFGPPTPETATEAHPRLRTAHEQARNVHDELMNAVDTLTRVLRKNLGRNQSFPPSPERP